ncbi:MAG: MFS transporter [Chloroflexi bacterium]|nr:MFS transporter [Chloroflexota bacterium]
MPSPNPLAWPAALALFFAASFIEAVGVAHVLAFAPLYLQQLGAAPGEVPYWTGLVSSGAFVVGLPLVPFWGVWAEKYSRKLIIARSAYVEALVFLLVGLSRSPLELAGAMLLSGFQLGNTGVMYAALTAMTPRQRVGFALSVLGVASTLGFALGPALGGLLADSVGLRPLYVADAALSLGSGLAVTLLFREARASGPAMGSVWRMAWEAVSGIVRVPVTRLVFLAYLMALLGRFMASPFLPLLVQDLYTGESVATVVGMVVGGTAVAGAVLSPLAGVLGDRLGYARVLGWSVAAGALASAGLALAPTLWALALAALLVGAALSAAAAMCTALLATTTPAERRSPTLNLALLPLYLGGIAGPVLGAALAALGLRAVFLGAAVPLAATLALTRRLRAREE